MSAHGERDVIQGVQEYLRQERRDQEVNRQLALDLTQVFNPNKRLWKRFRYAPQSIRGSDVEKVISVISSTSEQARLLIRTALFGYPSSYDHQNHSTVIHLSLSLSKLDIPGIEPVLINDGDDTAYEETVLLARRLINAGKFYTDDALLKDHEFTFGLENLCLKRLGNDSLQCRVSIPFKPLSSFYKPWAVDFRVVRS